jgi:osmoprotectant transport system ATP-binding protein
LITFEHVTKQYPGGTVAVDNLNLEIPDGQIMVLVGPSGGGKTTTLRMINRLTDPTGGRILLDGRDIQESKPAILRRGIGYVIQQGGLFPHRTVVDNIATVPLLVGWGKQKARERARELMDLVGLDAELAGRYPNQLSGGQQQRVGVARALAADPPVLLMDEPFSAVDPIVRASLQDELLRLQAELHKTVVFVTHDIEEAIKIGDQVAIFRPGGHLVQVDSPERLLAAPADSYVEDFIGFDRGIRRLSFLAKARKAGARWLLVTDSERLPRGWIATDQLESVPGNTTLADVPLTGYGHTFRADSDSLRAALDATVLSAAGQAIGVDADGHVVGVTSYDQLRAAIQGAADVAAAEAAPAVEGVATP